MPNTELPSVEYPVEGTVDNGSGAETVDEVVRRLIGEVIGEEYLVGMDITSLTSFSDDLEMESIEFVALAEGLQAHYGDRVDFVAWIADMELDDLIGMTVGQVVAFVERCVGS